MGRMELKAEPAVLGNLRAPSGVLRSVRVMIVITIAIVVRVVMIAIAM